MRRLNWWIAKNKNLVMILLCIIEVIVYSLIFSILSIPTWIIIFFDIFVIFVNYAYIDSIQNVLLKDSIRINDEECNPIPLLRETEELLSYKISEKNKQILLINQCAALRNMGEYRKVFEILTSINIDKFPGMLPIYKVIYYNNFADICMLLNKYEQADIWHEKMHHIYSDLSENKMKKSFEPIVLSAKASMLYRSEDYLQAIELLNNINPNCLNMRIDHALLSAQAYLKIGDKEKAKEKLQFIIEHGNKLYAVTEAKKLMNEME